ncbi:hypothetical protein BASA81_008379 [Batrachochytrium salamandrivorans]|nr:hypothetical protein BASA81_008379 [Batrachochytrium salamandrivorans]
MFSRLLQHRARMLVPAVAGGLLTTSSLALADNSDALPSQDAQPNPEAIAMEEGVYGISSYNANDPIEDRSDVQRLELLGGWWFAVFDGHSGWQAAQFAQRELHRNLEVELGNRLGVGHEENGMLGLSNPQEPAQLFEGKVHERLVSGALVAAFERTDRVYKSKVQGAFEVGFGRDTRAGSCALGALLVDGTLFVANLGDSRAVLGVHQANFNLLKENERQVPRFDSNPDNSPSTTTFHITNEFMRRAAVMKAQGEKLSPEMEQKLREVLAKEIAERGDIPNEPQTTAGIPQAPPVPPKKTGSGVTILNFLTQGAAGPSTVSQVLQPLKYLAVALSKDHNCREPRERKKLELEHPDELDVVVCKRPDICYIKGKLQPTRAFGDFYLKYSEFMRHPDQHASAGRYISPPYTPPYISASPEITVSKLRPGVDDFLILGTDGLWDFVTSQEAVNVVGADFT